MKISIIIPVFNEADTISQLICYLRENSWKKDRLEIIVIDGQSTDNTREIADYCQVAVLSSPYKCRSVQMNLCAGYASGDILYFLHADSFPPEHFDQYIVNAVKNGYTSGCFRMRWDKQGWFLSIFSWMTRFNTNLCRGGDQSLFVKAATFQTIKGFREDFQILEDMEIIPRLRKEGKFAVLPHYLTTSARRYHENGIIRLQVLFAVIHLMNIFGVPQHKLFCFYKKYIR
jgi:rSAM/selenodomain-associated transferase 2